MPTNLGVVRDAKEDASLTFRQVIDETRDNFPDKRYRPNEGGTVKSGKYRIGMNNDGTGTKPELAERLAFEANDPRYFESIAFDAAAMVVDDAARDGKFVVGVSNSVDVNAADPAFAAALARGLKRACDTGRFPLMNGETAELGGRTPGVGPWHLNWNMTALALTNEKKIIDGRGLRPGMPVVGVREASIRSNGLTRARAILEQAYLRHEHGASSKEAHIAATLRSKILDALLHVPRYEANQIGERVYRQQAIADARRAAEEALSASGLRHLLDEAFPGNDVLGQIQLPWHRMFPELTEKLLTPSTIYAPLVYEAQGGVDGDVRIPIVANAHVSGGGVPLKGKRMAEGRGVGLKLETVFPDPAGVPELLALAAQFPKADGAPLVTHRGASEQWNRGVGFMSVFEHGGHADEYVALAASMGYEAAVIGETTDEPTIVWRGETWNI